MSKDTYYFSHDANARHDEKILLVRSTFGWEGYGLFWAIVETMREAPNYRLNRHAIAGLSIGLGVAIDHLQRFLEYCFDIGLFQTDGAAYWSDSLVRRMESWDSRRGKLSKAGKKGAEKRWKTSEKEASDSKANGVAIATPMAIREEKRREEKRREEESINTPPPTPPDASVVVPDDETFRTAMGIYNAYPLPSNQQWALRAIRDAARRLTASGEMSEMQAMTYLLERTKAYAAIVKQAPIEQRSYAPAPARWFEEERFFDADETWRQRFRVGAVGNGAAAIGDYHAYGLFTRAESQNEFRRIKASGVDDPKFDTYDLPEGVALDGDTFLVRYRNSKLPPVPETLARLRPQKHAQGRFLPAPAPTTHPAAKNAVTELTDACNGTPNGSGAPS